VFQGTYQSETIRVSVLVPVSTTEASDEHTCMVSGTWQQGGSSGSTNSAVTQVIILPFSLCNITSDEPEKEVNKGDSVSFTINLKNEGNCDDEYESKGFSVDDIGNIAVPIRGSRDVEVKVHVPSDTSEKVCMLDIVVTGTAEENSEQFPFLLHARIEEGILSPNNPVTMIAFVIIIAAIITGIISYKRKKGKELGTATPPSQ
jgi:hypothetical protein